MATKFSLEDIQTLRRVSGISYEEAVALLEYHNGSLAQALSDLERHGKILNTSHAESEKKAGGFENIFQKAYQIRLVIAKDQTIIVNFSILYAVICLIFAPYLTIISFLVCLAMGYRIHFSTRDETFRKDHLKDTFRTAPENMKATVEEFARSFMNQEKTNTPEFTPKPEKPVERQATVRPERTTSSTFCVDVPVLHVPFRVHSQDGSMRVSQDTDGYNSATIE